MNTPLVSIIIPTYNRAHLIGETLDSVLAQTYTHWECIVVDDGSTDGTADLLADYCKKDVRFQYHHRPADRPKGANACRNYGFELSKGEYINWFDSDDLMLPKKLEIQVKELHNSSYDYTICQTMMFDVATNKEIGLRAPRLRSDTIFEDYILFKIFWLTGAPLWKNTFLTDCNLLFDETLQQSQEYDFHIRILVKSTNYLALDFVFVIFRLHTDNLSMNIYENKKKAYSNLRVKSKIFKNFFMLISDEGKIELFKKIIIVFKESTILSNHEISLVSMYCLFKNLKFIKLSCLKKVNFRIKVFNIFLSYFLFGKGYRLFKKIEKF